MSVYFLHGFFFLAMPPWVSLSVTYTIFPEKLARHSGWQKGVQLEVELIIANTAVNGEAVDALARDEVPENVCICKTHLQISSTEKTLHVEASCF